jgi:hypothetical protein
MRSSEEIRELNPPCLIREIQTPISISTRELLIRFSKTDSMDPSGREDVTTLLLEWSKGRKKALNQLMSLVYAELRQIAAHHLRSEDVGEK